MPTSTLPYPFDLEWAADESDGWMELRLDLELCPQHADELHEAETLIRVMRMGVTDAAADRIADALLSERGIEAGDEDDEVMEPHEAEEGEVPGTETEQWEANDAARLTVLQGGPKPHPRDRDQTP